MKKIENVLIGADPEFFLFNRNTEKFVPSVGLIGGTKDNPLPITGEGHCIQEDNVMVEFNVPASNNPVKFYEDIQLVLKHVQGLIPENFNLAIVPSAYFDEKDLESPQARHFGCDPDFNIWTGRRNKVGSGNPLLRTAGGHVHIGYSEPSESTSTKIICALDLFLGVPSILLDTDTERRKMYGKAGAFRMKSYGVEYRVLSNFWINNQELVFWVFDNVNAAIEFINSGKEIAEFDVEKIIGCINNSDKEAAKELCEKYTINYKLETKDKVDLIGHFDNLPENEIVVAS
jgi:hypothetical protein